MNPDAVETKRAYYREKMRKYRAMNPEKARAHRKAAYERLMSDPIAGEKARAYRKEYNKSYHSSPQAKERKRQRDLLNKYGLTAPEFEAMRKAQNNLCLLCANEMNLAVVDHCHSSGKVRGLLCKDCNTGLGHFKDNPDVLRRAVDYIEVNKVSAE